MTSVTRLVESTGGVRLAVHDLGGSGHPLLLAHATGFHGRVWAPLARHLEGHGFRCWAPDLRGHGDSTAPDDGQFHWDGFADDVLAVVDALGMKRPFGVGHSKGGAALLLAEEQRPGTFRALYLFEPVVFPPDVVEATDHAGSNPLVEGALRRRSEFESFDAAYDNFATKPPFSALDPEALRAYVDHGFAPTAAGTVALKCRPEHEAQVYRMGATHHAFAQLDRVTCPVVVTRGGFTGFGPATFVERIVAALPHGRIEEHPELGHFGPLEEPEAIAATVRRAFAAT
ncbi:alpha/beta fold hydrolase [Rhabdothermincola sediminis]|uniref:alpha/beta fold hydrolase n=1 Tax=Rhabdothermincola sediminis TaxID=2751370 RepID=UPI001AA0965E|nr:alpha/beta hydrolase [Rhabdothermincola sediminis]